MSRIPSAVLIALVTVYRRAVSPLLGQHCRYYPSCSAYAVEALRTHGALRGSWFTLRRLLRCQPFFPGGYDPVPPARDPDARTTAPAGSPASARGAHR